MKTKGVLILLVTLLFLFPIASNEAAPFYKGKTMKLIVCTKPGGGYDFYGRLTARFMQKYLPGSTIIVKNVPGAGNIIGVNEIYRSKPNGLTIGSFNRALPVTQIVGVKGVKFDVIKMGWLGSAASEIYSLIMSPRFKTLEDIRKAPLVRMGSSGLGSGDYFFASMFKEMTGLKNIRISTGYMAQETELAMIRGELDGQFGSWSSMKPFSVDGHGVPVMFVGKNQPSGYEHVPMLEDVITEEKYQTATSLLTNINILARPFVTPPGIPKDRMKILIGAYEKAYADPELLNYAKRARRPIHFVKGEEAFKRVKKMLNVTPELKALIKKAYGVK